MQLLSYISLSRLWLSSANNSRTQGKRTRNSRTETGTSYEVLESRRVLAAIFLNTSSGELFISGGSGNDVGALVATGGNQVEASITGAASQTFNANDIASVTFIGNAGNDRLTNNTDIVSSFFGGNGNDILTGGSNDDFIVGDSGSDTLNGGDGDDQIIGGFGDDDISGGQGNDTIFGSADENTIFGNSGDDIIFGGDAIDTIFGGDGIDQIYGLDGDDILDAGDGGVAGTAGIGQADLILGLGGNDTITGGNGLNVLWGGDGNDIITGGNSAENRLHGQAGNDILTGGDGNDFIRGLEGENTIVAGAGNDFIIAGLGDEDFDGGTGFDTIRFTGNYSSYRINENTADVLTVRDLRDIDPQGDNDTSNAERFEFADQTRDPAISSLYELVVRPIVVSNTNGSNTATFFGDAATQLEIENLIDDIFAQANIDVVWENAVSYNNTFANFGNPGRRPGLDLNRIVDAGDAAGVGSSNPNVIDAYFVQRAAGFGSVNDSTANGLAFVNANGTSIHVGDNLLNFQAGIEVIAGVVAHELGHNLGLNHVEAASNLLNSGQTTRSNGNNFITSGQIATIQNSRFTRPLGGVAGSVTLLASEANTNAETAGLVATVQADGSVDTYEFHDGHHANDGHDHSSSLTHIHDDNCTCANCC